MQNRMKRIARLVICLLAVLNLLSFSPVPVEYVPSDGSVSRIVYVVSDKVMMPSVYAEGEDLEKVNMGDNKLMDDLMTMVSKVADQGVERLRPHVFSLIGVLAIIGIASNWALYDGQLRLTNIVGTIMKICFFFWLAMNWEKINGAIFTSLSNLGLVGAGMAPITQGAKQVLTPSTLIDYGFESTNVLWDGLSILAPGEALVKIFAMLLIIFSHFMLAFELFIATVEFKIFVCLALVLMPFGVIQHTSFLFQRCVSGVFGYGAKVMVINFLIGLIYTHVNLTETGFTKSSTSPDILKVALSFLLLGYLVWKCGDIAQGFASGSPALSGGGLARTVAGATVGVAAVAATAVVAGAAKAAGVGATVSEKTPDSETQPATQQPPSGTAIDQQGQQSQGQTQERPSDTAVGSPGYQQPSVPQYNGAVAQAGYAVGDAINEDQKREQSGGASNAQVQASQTRGAEEASYVMNEKKSESDASTGGAGTSATGGRATEAYNKLKGTVYGFGNMAKETLGSYRDAGMSRVNNELNAVGDKVDGARRTVMDSSAGQAVSAAAHDMKSAVFDKGALGNFDAVCENFEKGTAAGYAAGFGNFVLGSGKAVATGVGKVAGAASTVAQKTGIAKAATFGVKTAGYAAMYMGRAMMLRNPASTVILSQFQQLRNDQLNVNDVADGRMFNPERERENRN